MKIKRRTVYYFLGRFPELYRGDKPSPEFLETFRDDFKVELCLHPETEKGFVAAVARMQKKWDDIGKQTGNRYINTREWNSFYKGTVEPVHAVLFRKKDLCPELYRNPDNLTLKEGFIQGDSCSGTAKFLKGFPESAGMTWGDVIVTAFRLCGLLRTLKGAKR